MGGKGAQGTVELSKPPYKTPADTTAGSTPLGGRVFSVRNVASFLLAVAVLYLMYREFLGVDWGEALASVREANAWLFALAFVIFYCSFPLRALRWKALLANVGYSREAVRPMPSTLGLTRIMYVAWFANCVTVARLGDAYRGYLLKREAGVSFAVTLGTILAERLLDLLVLAAMMGAGVLVVFGGSLPTEATQALAAGLILSVVGIAALLSMRRLRWAFERILPKRLHAFHARFEHGVVDSFRRLPLLVALSAVGWVLEGAALYAVAAAVGAPVSVAGALVVALAASLLSTVPITPAGLGFTEAGLVVMLGWLGMDVTTATAATLLFRVINYWSIVVLGFVLFVFGRKGRRPIEDSVGKPANLRKFISSSRADHSLQIQTKEREIKVDHPAKKGRDLMVRASIPQRDDTLPHRQVSVEVVVPVYNEQEALPKSIPGLCAYLETYFPYRWSVVIADNASTDATLAVAEGLAYANPRVSVLHLEEKGRGRALKAAWLASEADVVAYMDVDLSTNLWSFLPLVAPLATGHSDVAIGSRLLRGAMVTRQWKREVISRCYNLLIKILFGNRFSDAQCGFKAIKRSAAQQLLPHVEDGEWFFDTELLLLAEERGYRVSEVLVDWIEDLDTRVDIGSTALKDVKGLLRVRAQRLRRWLSNRNRPSEPRSREVLDTVRHARSLRLMAKVTAAVEARKVGERG